MKRYLHIYLTIIRLNYHKSIINKGDFFSGLFASICWGIFSVVLIYILSFRSASVFGWTKQELFVLIGVTNIILGSLFRMTATTSLDDMPLLVQHGELDVFLLKPIDSQFLLSFLQIRLYGTLRLIISIIFTLFILHQANIHVTIFSIINFIVLSICGFITVYAIWFLVMTFSIWFPDLHNLSEILYSTDSLTRYPPQVLWAMRIFLFYIFFPYTIAISTPAKALLHKITIFDAALLVFISFGLLYLSKVFWKFALRYYTSASG